MRQNVSAGVCSLPGRKLQKNGVTCELNRTVLGPMLFFGEVGNKKNVNTCRKLSLQFPASSSVAADQMNLNRAEFIAALVFKWVLGALYILSSRKL